MLLTPLFSLKINFKLRGVSHELVRNPTDRYSPSGTKWNTMIVGADVTHPAKGSEGCPSIAAIVATNDDMSSHYLGSARLQKSKDEVMIHTPILGYCNQLLTSPSASMI